MAPAADRERGERRTEERCRADETDFKLSEPEREQVGGQQHGDETVGECAQRPRREHAADHHYFEP